MPIPPRYSFGPFVFDAKERVLYRDSQDVGLPPKAVDTLALLLAHAGAVVEKRVLLDLAWAGMVVGEGSLTRTISILRKALDDDANSDTYIATISKRGYRFQSPVVCAASSPAQDQPSIAVLPFDCFSANPSEAYFSDGLTEETTAQLCKRGGSWLRVIARTTCMLFKGSSKRINDIGRELGVGYVLEGSVRGGGGRLRIAAQLIRVRDETHVWAESYERRIGDALRLQCAVAGKISHEVQTWLASHGTVLN
jgi:TolB-like protein